ncbi:MAG TPA: aldolase/citrate lyase family protein, partial [Quisquiliibacterium sp.]|nr:aldolase/citrate lyase family protein [Quisquiliibacterium sp.]
VEAAKARKKRIGFELIIETALGMANIHEIAKSSKRLESLHFGVADYAASTRARTTVIGGPNPDYVVLTDKAEDGSRDLVVLAPRRRVSQYRVAPDASIHAVPVRPQLARRAIAVFQQASETFTSGQYRHVPERLAVARPRGVGGS